MIHYYFKCCGYKSDSQVRHPSCPCHLNEYVEVPPGHRPARVPHNKETNRMLARDKAIAVYQAIRATKLCPHLGKPTGRIIRLRGCRNGGRRRAVVYQCDKYDCEVTEYKTGIGRNCQVCKYQQENE